MQISRRDALLGATAAAITTAAIAAPLAHKAAGVRSALAGEEAQVLALFRQLGDKKRASVHYWARVLAGLPDDPALARRINGRMRS